MSRSRCGPGCRGTTSTSRRPAATSAPAPFTTFRLVTFPLLLPGIVAGCLLAFALSIDDFVITQFNAGQTLTFPLWVFGATRLGVPPQVNVMGTLIFVGGVLIAISSVLHLAPADL